MSQARKGALRTVVPVVVALLALAYVWAGRGVSRSGASTTFAFTRISGPDRYGTAAAIAESTFGTSPVAVLATGEDYPDALAGAYAAGIGRVPILLTTTAVLPSETLTALQTLKTTKVLILGGTSAVSAAVEEDLNSRGIQTSRIGGTDRYDTARLVAESGGLSAVGTTGGAPTAIVASGENFPDALSSSPIAYVEHFPTLLTTTDTLSTATEQALTALGIKAVIVPGGTAAVSDAVVTQIQDMGISVDRIAGVDRTDTAAQLATFEQGFLKFSTSHVNLARGDDFADALAGSTHAGQERAPVLLTENPNTLGTPTGGWLANHAQPLTDGHIFGGTSAVTNATATTATNFVVTNSVPPCTTATTLLPGGGSTTSTACVPSGGATTTTSAPGMTLPPLPGLPTPTTTTTVPGATTTTSTTTPGMCFPAAPFCFPALPTPTSTTTSTSTTVAVTTTTA